MAKRLLKLTVRIPPYQTPRNAWRKKLHKAILQRHKESQVVYNEKDKLEVEVRLYMTGSALRSHDVDNQLKDVLDASKAVLEDPKVNTHLRLLSQMTGRYTESLWRRGLLRAKAEGWAT